MSPGSPPSASEKVVGNPNARSLPYASTVPIRLFGRQAEAGAYIVHTVAFGVAMVDGSEQILVPGDEVMLSSLAWPETVRPFATPVIGPPQITDLTKGVVRCRHCWCWWRKTGKRKYRVCTACRAKREEGFG